MSTYISNNTYFSLLGIVILTFAWSAGFLFAFFINLSPIENSTKAIEIFQPIFQHPFVNILFNNIGACLLLLLSGFISFGAFSVVFSIYNGLAISG